MKRQKGSAEDIGAIFVLLYILVALALLVGWAINVFKVVSDFGGPLTVKLVLRIVGIFAVPLGGILGYIS